MEKKNTQATFRNYMKEGLSDNWRRTFNVIASLPNRLSEVS
jgi:hypothetical protein